MDIHKDRKMILAKSAKSQSTEITLSAHVRDVLRAFEVLKGTLNGLDENLGDLVRIAIFLHDLGKALPAFQIRRLHNKEYEPWDVVYEVPHSLFSIFLTDTNELKRELEDKFGFEFNDFFNFLISSVAYHHWRDGYEDYLLSSHQELIAVCKKLKEEWGKRLLENLRSELRDFQQYLRFIGINEDFVEAILNKRKLVKLAVPPYTFDYEPLRDQIKKEWIIISGILQRCDHFASWCEAEGIDQLDKIEQKVEVNVRKNVERRISSTAWQFSKIGKTVDKNVILVAPTGYGKTEFAFLWSNSQKLLYTLPLRSAVNQIYERATNIFGRNKVGLLHSDADVYLLEKDSEVVDPMKTYELSRQLSHPVIISTGDQFFPYALRPPGYEKIFVTLSHSRLVIDEIQAYDPKACAIIVKFLEWVQKMGGKFLLVTATLPKFVKEYLEENGFIEGVNFHEINIYEEERGYFEKIIKHKIKVERIKGNSGEIPEDQIRRIIEKAKEGKRVLVIVNTVRSAKAIFEKLKSSADGCDIFLLHSEFTFNDRRNKEEEILENFRNPKPVNERKPKILVATQVVEASLDIDADCLFTEICPLDSLVQRMGRVARRYMYINGKVVNKSERDGQQYDLDEERRFYGNEPNVYIWMFEESHRYVVYSEEQIKRTAKCLGLDSKEEQELSEYRKYELVRDFYEPSELKKYLDEFYKTIDILNAGFMSERKSEAFRIFREIYTIPVIPEGRKEEFIREIEAYVAKYGDSISYSSFKQEVLSDFVVNLDARKYMHEGSTFMAPASRFIYEAEIEDEKKNRILKWLEGVYLCSGKYDHEKGFLHEGRESNIVD
ncbi:CRISPR-associated helicase Cas3' [Pseudothermotoga sp. U03pept]|uniref:CRISPR-associated helicase Cas3' n=1 Tax=Pseudothermotoga sp. U03pept TaxID=3447012 RepID=UPI003F0F0F5B